MNGRMLPGILLAIALPLAGCSPEGALGEECDTPGGLQDVCEPGTVCGRYVNNHPQLTCLWICNDHDQCARSERCNGLDYTNLKGCQLD